MKIKCINDSCIPSLKDGQIYEVHGIKPCYKRWPMPEWMTSSDSDYCEGKDCDRLYYSVYCWRNMPAWSCGYRFTKILEDTLYPRLSVKELKGNTKGLGTKAICGNCGYIDNIEMFAFDHYSRTPKISIGPDIYRGIRIEYMSREEDPDYGEYLHITCPKCTYREKVD
jgi:hypothetical protein